MKRLFWIIGLAIALVAFLVLMAGHAYGQTIDIEIGTIRGDPFELVFIRELPAGVGDSCTGQVDARNNESTRDDTDFVFISGGEVVLTIAGVEAVGFDGAGIGFTSNGPIETYIRLGVEGLYSAGVLLEVTCNPPTTTTTTTSIPSSSTTVTTSIPSTSTTSTSTPASTTTLSPPPVGGVDTGAGACADGACDGFSLSPLATWTLYIAAWLIAIMGLSTFIAIVSRKESGG